MKRSTDQITKSAFPQISFFLAIVVLLAATTLTNQPAATEAAPIVLEYAIDRAAVPSLNYTDLTLIINVSDASSIVVTDEDSNPITYKSGPAADEITLTTTGETVKVTLDGITDQSDIGTFRKANLKDDYAWAYSHGFDDNIFLDAERKAFLDRGIPATYNLISSPTFVLPEPNEFWLDDFHLAEFYEIIDAGWDINNHTTDHETSDDPMANGCSDTLSEAQRKADVLEAQSQIKALLAGSSRPDYKVIGFAIPCGGSIQFQHYPGIVHEIRDNAEDTLLYYEGGGSFPYQMDVSPPFDFNRGIDRDGDIDGAGAVSSVITGRFDTISTESQQSGTPYWYTTISHGTHLFGSNLTALEETLDYLIGTYGSNGTNEVWIAPTATVYSYLLVRDKSVVTQVQGPEATSTPVQTATAQPTQTTAPTTSATKTSEPVTTVSPTATQDLSNNDIFTYLPITISED